MMVPSSIVTSKATIVASSSKVVGVTLKFDTETMRSWTISAS